MNRFQPSVESDYGEPISLSFAILAGVAVAGQGTAFGLRYAANKKLTKAQQGLAYQQQLAAKQMEETAKYVLAQRQVSEAEEAVHQAEQRGKYVRWGAAALGVLAVGIMLKYYEPDDEEEVTDEG
jgi:hypothetical protein